MVVKNICLNINGKKRYIIIIIVFLLIVISNLLMLNAIKGKKIGKNILNNMSKSNMKDILDMTSYYAEYEMTISSNKNVNTYFVKEWYKANVGSKLEYLDSTNNKVITIYKEGKYYVSNKANKLELTGIDDYENQNLLLLSSFINWSFKIESNACACKKIVGNKEEKETLNILIETSENCELSKISKKYGIERLELILNLKGLPETYVLYGENEKEINCIVYTKFELNILIDDLEFNV